MPDIKFLTSFNKALKQFNLTWKDIKEIQLIYYGDKILKYKITKTYFKKEFKNYNVTDFMFDYHLSNISFVIFGDNWWITFDDDFEGFRYWQFHKYPDQVTKQLTIPFDKFLNKLKEE